MTEPTTDPRLQPVMNMLMSVCSDSGADPRKLAMDVLQVADEARSSPDIEINEADDTIRLFGTLYALSLFRHLSVNGFQTGACFRIVGREDSVVHLQRITDPIS